jgi:hypothetical protein
MTWFRRIEKVSGRRGSVLEHWVAVEGQIILDHAVGDLLGHLALGHFMLWQIFSGEAGAVDGGGEGVIDAAAAQVDLLHAVDEGLVDLMVFGDGGEVNHDCGVVRDLRGSVKL